MILLLAVCALSISACDNKKKPTEMIKSPDPVLLERQSKMEERLAEKTGLVYLKEYRYFSGGSKTYLPCDVNLRQELDLAAKEVQNLEQIARTHKDHTLYRDSALEFFRKLIASAESLKAIGLSLEAYCLYDAQKVESCVGPADQSLRVQININIAGYRPVHPSIRPNDTSKVYLYSLNIEKRVRGKFVTDAKDINFSPKTALEQNTTKAEISKISSCLQSKKVEHDIAKQVSDTFSTAETEITADCEDMKADALKRRVELSPLITRFCE